MSEFQQSLLDSEIENLQLVTGSATLNTENSLNSLTDDYEIVAVVAGNNIPLFRCNCDGCDGNED